MYEWSPAYGSGSYIAHPVLKAIIVILVAGSCYFIALVVRSSAINNRKSLLMSPPDLFGEPKLAELDQRQDENQQTRSKSD